MADPGRHAGAGAAQRHSGPWVCPECGASYTGAGACPADGHVVQRATDSLLGQMVGNYRLTRLIGAGGMGRVYQAVQPSIGARVAVKVLSSDVGQDRELVERFFAEARAVNLIRHEQIVNIVDLDFLPDGRPYIVMEFLEGRPLSAVMAARGPLPLGTLAQLMIEVLGALAAAHEHRVVHRDLKPDNIFVSPQGRAKVLDFGIAKLDRGAGMSGATRAGAILGTPQYMSPEQALSRPVDARTDLYAAGVILYEGVSGRPPFAGDSMFELLQKQIGEPPPLLRPLRPELPVAYEQVILRAMAKDPADRFASAAEMSAALASATAGLGPEAWAPLGTAPAPPVTPAQSREARNLWTTIALAALALALALAGTVALLARGRGGGADAGTRVTVTPDAATRVAREWGPPRLYTQLSSGGYIMSFVLPGRPLEILWRVAGEGDYRPTGDDPQTLDPASGRPVAKIWFLLDPPRGPITLQVKYRTPDDVWHGPFDIKLDPAEAAVREAKEMLGMLPRWIELRDFEGTRLAYFTTLVMLRDALTVIEYGFDEEPSRRLRFTPSDRPSRDIADEDEVYVVVPRGTKQVSVRVSYRDGTRSEIHRYDTPPGEPEPVAKMPMNPDDLSWLVELARLLGDEGLTRPLAVNYLGSDAGDDGSGRDGHIVSPRSPYLGRVVVYALPAAGIDVAIDLELGVRPSRKAMQLAFGALRSVARAPGDRPSGGKLAADVPGTRAVVRLLVELDPDDRSRVARVQVTAAPRPPGGS